MRHIICSLSPLLGIKPTSGEAVSDSGYLKTFENWISVLEMVEQKFDGATQHGSAYLFSILNVWCKNVHSSSVHEKVCGIF